MSDGMNILAAAAFGKAMAGDNSAGIADERARSEVSTAERTASIATTEREIERMGRVSAEAEGRNWRIYANRLNNHLAARKMSEATLLEELKKANISHPLATAEGFEELFDKALAEQYGADEIARDRGEMIASEIKALNEVGKDRAAVK